MSEDEIHKLHRPMFDIAEKEYEDISCDWYQYIPYYDANLNNPNTVPDFRIEINDRESYFYPHKSYIEFAFNIVKTDGTAFTAGEAITLQNNAASLIKRYEFMLDDVIVDYVDNPDISLTVRNLVYMSNDHLKTASQFLFYPDTVDNPVVDATTTILLNGNGNTGGPGTNNIVITNPYTSILEAVNQGMRKRWLTTYNSTIVTLQLPLKNVFGLFQSYDKVTKGIKMSMRLTKNDYSNILLATTGVAAGQIQFAKNGIKWWMPRIKPNPSIMPMLTSKLSSQANYMIPFIDLQVYRSPLYTAPQTNQIYQIRTKRKRPLKVFVCFQIDDPTNANNFVAFPGINNIGPFANTARISGAQTQNKRLFDHVNLQKLRVVLNGTTQYPEQEYSMSFPTIPTNAVPAPTSLTADVGRIYSEFLRCGLRDHGIDEGVTVSHDMFKSLYPIFCIDLSEKPEYFVNPESSLIEVYWTNQTVINYYMWTIIESEKQLEMSSNDGQMKLLNVIN